MKIISIHRLRGPNVYLSRPAVIARVRLEELTGRETSDVTGFTERLLRVLPGLAEHHCAAGVPGGFVSRLRGGTYFGHVTEHVCIELSQLIGRDVSFGRTVSAGEPGMYDLIVECPQDESPESALPAALLGAAVDVVTAVLSGAAGPLAQRLGGVGIDIAGDKQVTRMLLAEAGVPVVPGGAARTAEEAVRLLARLGAPVVVKPRHGRQ